MAVITAQNVLERFEAAAPLEKLIQCRRHLLRAAGFWGMLAMQCPLVPMENLPHKTMATDGHIIAFHPDFVRTSNVWYVRTAFAHEVGHNMLCHHTRRGLRIPEVWNIACDYVVNDMLRTAGFTISPNWLYDPRYHGMSAEQVYDILMKELRKRGKKAGDAEGHFGKAFDDICDAGALNTEKPNGNGNGGKDGKEKPSKQQPTIGSPMTQSQKHAEESRIKRMVEAAAKIASKAGKMPGGLERFIKELLEPEIDWREALAAWAVELAKNDYTYSRPNKRYIRYGLYMPSMHSNELNTLVLIVDSSSSMDNERLNRVFTEGHAMLSTINCSKMIVLYVSTRIKGMQEFEAGDDPKALGEIEFGRGGTDFRPGFEWIAENEIEPCGVIYLTDGECNSFPDEEPSYPVLWGRTTQQHYFKDRFEPPFGEVINIRT